MESLEDKIKRLETSLNNLKGVFLEKLNAPIEDSVPYKTNVKIVSHLDADGLTSASILALTLKRENIGYTLSIIKQLKKSNIEKITANVKKNNQIIIFCDLGSGQQHVIEEYINPTEYIILDHHEPIDFKEKDKIHKINHVNPHFYGIDGSNNISGAGMCYLFAKTFNEKNRDLAHLAIIGAIGDMQNKGKKGTFLGINKYVLDDAINFGKIRLESNLAISRTDPLTHSLVYTLNEKISGLYQNFDQAREILSDTKIKITNELNQERNLIDLSMRERQTLNTKIIQYAFTQGYDKTVVDKIITTFYILIDFEQYPEMSDGKEMANLLNACGRMGKQSVAISLLMGDVSVIEEAIQIKKKYSEFINKAIIWAQNHFKSHNFINTLDARGTIDESKISTIASIICNKNGFTDKPFILYTNSNSDALKISARIHQSLVEKGLDLAEILKEIHDEMFTTDFLSGGHKPAAGGYIPTDKIEPYLELINEKIGKKLT